MNFVLMVLKRILVKTKLLKMGKKIPKFFNSIQKLDKATEIYDKKLSALLNVPQRFIKKNININKYKNRATQSLYKRLSEDKQIKIRELKYKYRQAKNIARLDAAAFQRAKEVKENRELNEKLKRFFDGMESDSNTKKFNDHFSKNGDEMESVVLGLNASFIKWGIYEPIPYKKGFGNLTLQFRTINIRNGKKISSSKNPSLIYKWGIGQKQPPIAYWMWEAVVKSANGGTTFWNVFWRNVKNNAKLERGNPEKQTRAEYYKENKIIVKENKNIINRKVGSKTYMKKVNKNIAKQKKGRK